MGIRADRTGIPVSYVEAGGAEGKPALQLKQRVGEFLNLHIRTVKKVIGEPLRTLRPDTGKFAQRKHHSSDGFRGD